MEILLNNEIPLFENKPYPFYKGDLIFFGIKNEKFSLDLFSKNNNSQIKLFNLMYPNKNGDSLEDIKEIATLFPFLKENIYKKTGITAYEIEELTDSTPVVVKINEYNICFAILGGEYSRNPGTKIILLGIRRTKGFRQWKIINQ